MFAVIRHCHLVTPLTFLSKAPTKPIFSLPNLLFMQSDLLSMLKIPLCVCRRSRTAALTEILEIHFFVFMNNYCTHTPVHIHIYMA